MLLEAKIRSTLNPDPIKTEVDLASEAEFRLVRLVNSWYMQHPDDSFDAGGWRFRVKRSLPGQDVSSAVVRSGYVIGSEHVSLFVVAERVER